MVTLLAPATVTEVAGALRAAGDDGLTVLPRGSGSKVHWGGTPSRVDIVLDTRRLTGVLSHEPGDLVVTVRAGAQLRDLQAVLALAGQRLALESGSPEATVGGVLASGEAGPLRLRHGTGRDQLIGVEFVQGDAALARSGGRVVKNVAGYDLGRLLCGSYGTLGVITSATFRLRPLPAARCFVGRPVGSLRELSTLLARLAGSTLEPAAVEVDLKGKAGTLAVLVEGSRTGAVARTAAVAELLGSAAPMAEPDWWGRYPFGTDDIAMKLAVPVARLGQTLDALAGAAGGAVAVRGSAAAGVVYAALPGDLPAGDLAAVLSEVRWALADTGPGGGSCVVLAAPSAVRDAVDIWGPVPGLSLMRRIKHRLDPGGTLAAGRYVGGI